MAAPHPPDTEHTRIVQDLRVLRERGLIRLRRLQLPALGEAARRHAGSSDGAGADPGPDAAGIERLLRKAVDALGDEEPGQAAAYLFGLVQGTVGRRPTDLRERAAGVFRVSPETFRKERERLLLDRLADEILRLLPEPSPAPASVSAAGPPVVHGPATDQPRPASSGPPEPAVVRLLESSLRDLREQPSSGPDARPFGRYGPFRLLFGDRTAVVTVDLGPVEELRDVHLLVSSENTYLQPARLFSRTLSGQLRSAAAERDEAGTVTYDTVAEELAAWAARHARTGGPVAPGVVVPTSAGRLSEHGVRRLLHAAVAVPKLGEGGYDVPDTGVHRAVRECFVRARAERDLDRTVDSFALPLFGAGDGGLSAAASFSRLWPALQGELTADPTWHVHLTTWTLTEVAVVLDGLLTYARSTGTVTG